MNFKKDLFFFGGSRKWRWLYDFKETWIALRNVARTHNFIIFSVTYQDLSKWLLLSQQLLFLPKCAMPPFPRSQVCQGCSLSPFWTLLVLHRKAAKWSQKGVWLACLLCALLSGLEIYLFHNSVIELVFKCIALAILKAILIFRNYFLDETEVCFPPDD